MLPRGTLEPASSWQRSTFPLASGAVGRCPAGKSGVTLQREAAMESFGSGDGVLWENLFCCSILVQEGTPN